MNKIGRREWLKKIIVLACVIVLAACDETKQQTLTISYNSPQQIEPLTRLNRDNPSVTVRSNEGPLDKGKIVFVPVYSHIYHGDRQEPFLLTITLSIRNTSLTKSLVVRSIRYYNSAGKLVKQSGEGNLQIAPLAAAAFYIPQQDVSGGSGASFIVEWVTDEKAITEPVIEAVMISTSFQQGVSFTSTGKVIGQIKP
ncbi:MAG: hypothetical protein N5P05_000288 [Chroococcopsis gigantea SAG 12.99]|jgi:hypothetical protein|nr:hypothetical protein [Chroococcopsis gigantea SAG 12.99]